MTTPVSIPIKLAPDIVVHGRNPIVVIGPNGSGKTRFGHKVAGENSADIIVALRNIELGANVPMRSVKQAENELKNHLRQRTRQPWSLSNEINHLFAKLMAEDSAAAVEFRENYSLHGNLTPEVTKLMRLSSIWERLFPGRHITFKGYSPMVMSEHMAGEMEYPAQQMSDGERVALYLAARVLDAKSSIIVIDEPEVHFHSRLATRFWDELEGLRPECRFVYITHDLPFALSRETDQFVLVKPGVPPETISLAKQIPGDLSEALLAAASVSIFAKRLVFCEGTESSYDQAFLRGWFNGRDTAVVPVGSCRDVIRCTRTFREEGLVTGITALGIIDRDYWPDAFLQSVPEGITILPCHEIESLMCRKGVFLAVAEHQGLKSDEANTRYNRFLAEAKDRFARSLLVKQVSARFRCRCEEQYREIMNRLSVEDDLDVTRTKHCECLTPARWQISPEQLFDEERERVEGALGGNGEDFLTCLPGKVYFSILVKQLGMTKEAYFSLITRALSADLNTELAVLGGGIQTDLDGILPKRRIEEIGQQEDSGDGNHLH
jgi:ABC-type branched-subunit amino acid transport system ATPase component